jgi:hypothetical protein
MNDTASLAAEVLRRDQRRVRRIAGLTIGLWSLAALVIPGFYLPYLALVEPKVQLLEKLALEKDPSITTHLLAGHIAVTTRAAAVATIGFLTAFTLTSLLAAICTIWMVFTVRRVTLRQLSEGLADISIQLKRLERPA